MVEIQGAGEHLSQARPDASLKLLEESYTTTSVSRRRSNHGGESEPPKDPSPDRGKNQDQPKPKDKSGPDKNADSKPQVTEEQLQKEGIIGAWAFVNDHEDAKMPVADRLKRFEEAIKNPGDNDEVDAIALGAAFVKYLDT